MALALLATYGLYLETFVVDVSWISKDRLGSGKLSRSRAKSKAGSTLNHLEIFTKSNEACTASLIQRKTKDAGVHLEELVTTSDRKAVARQVGASAGHRF